MKDISFAAAVLRKQKRPLDLIENIRPTELKSGQVLVKLAYSGVCHSQIMEIEGYRGEDKFLPHMLGHEGSGIVIDTGKDVKKVKKNDTVVLTWIKSHGIEAGGTIYCSDEHQINAGGVTTFNEFAVVSENRCVIIPRSIPMDIAALFGCAVLTGSGIIKNTIDPNDGTDIAIFGLGGVGISAMAATKLYPLKNIFAVDVIPERLEMAKEFGANHLIDARIEDPVKYIRNHTNGFGVDYAVDAAGITKTIEQSFECVNKENGLAVFASHPRFGEKISIDPFDLICGKRIIGTWGGEADPDQDIPFFASKYLEGIMPLEKLISKKYELNEINFAIEDLKNGKVVRPIIEIDKTIKNSMQ